MASTTTTLCLNCMFIPPSSSPLRTATLPLQYHRRSTSLIICNSSTPNSPTKPRGRGEERLKPIVITGNPPTFVSAPGRRIIAVGDLHGDLSKARSALNIAGLLSPDDGGQDLWTGGETVLIQLGDILDRGEDEIAILSLLRSLDIQARAKGGAVFQINGNHETMNVNGDFRYVDSGAFDEYLDFVEYLDDCDHNWEQAFLNWIDVSTKWKEERKSSRSYWGPWSLVKDRGRRV